MNGNIIIQLYTIYLLNQSIYDADIIFSRDVYSFIRFLIPPEGGKIWNVFLFRDLRKFYFMHEMSRQVKISVVKQKACIFFTNLYDVI